MYSATAINTRWVLRIYTWIVLPIALVLCDNPTWIPDIEQHMDLPGVPWGRAGLVRLIAGAVTILGFSALGMSGIENPESRRRALKWFAIGHIYFGLFFAAQSVAVFDQFIPRFFWTMPLAVGVILLFVALTSARAPRLPAFRFRPDEPDEDHPGPVVMLHERGPRTSAVQSQYEEHIRQAARLEERARLARDLHDAVKQQLFAIQTSAAAAQERLGSDPAGAHSALDQVRTCARDAMTEMKAMIEQLQASPIENTGLVAALQQQCEALGLRTGADVKLDVGRLPSSSALAPGAQQALFRAAQEALSNVARHARATQVAVRLGLNKDRLELTVRDNGAGFDMQTIQPGMGLKNMSGRMHGAGGSMLISPQAGGGTLIVLSVPCDFDTATGYAVKAWIAVAAGTLAALNRAYGDWTMILAAIALITAARYGAAWWRTRGRAEVAIA